MNIDRLVDRSDRYGSQNIDTLGRLWSYVGCHFFERPQIFKSVQARNDWLKDPNYALTHPL